MDNKLMITTESDRLDMIYQYAGRKMVDSPTDEEKLRWEYVMIMAKGIFVTEESHRMSVAIRGGKPLIR